MEEEEGVGQLVVVVVMMWTVSERRYGDVTDLSWRVQQYYLIVVNIHCGVFSVV